MHAHSFLFRPGLWLGQGTIQISGSQEQLQYYTRWKIAEAAEGVIFCIQEVEIAGIPEKKINTYIISEMTALSFAIELENENLSIVYGKGLIRENIVAWELQGPGQQCEGVEIFQFETEDRYSTHAEFGSDGQANTVIKGVIWKSAG